MTITTYIGCDNGLDGAFTGLLPNGAIAFKEVMPYYKVKTPREGLFDKKGKQKYSIKRTVDVEKCYEILKPYLDNMVFLIELPAGSKDVKSAKSMADSFATVRTLMELYRIEVNTIRALQWQKSFWIKPRGSNKDTKEYALETCQQYWPGEDWKKTKRCTTAHDGLTDSALIAEYARKYIL